MTLRLLSGLTATGVDAAIAQAVEDHTPGIELGGPAERVTNFTTTAVVATTISGLTAVVTGLGRPCEIRFTANRVYHSAHQAATPVQIDLQLISTTSGGGSVPIGSDAVWTFSTTTGRGVNIIRTMTLTEGTQYTFTATTTTATAGTTTIWATGGRPMQISVKSA